MPSKTSRSSRQYPVPSPVRASWLSAAIIFAPLSLLGEVLLVSTHHRPLGAATFASVAVVCWGVSEVISRRLLNSNESVYQAKARRIVWGLSILASALVFLRALL